MQENESTQLYLPLPILPNPEATVTNAMRCAFSVLTILLYLRDQRALSLEKFSQLFINWFIANL